MQGVRVVHRAAARITAALGFVVLAVLAVLVVPWSTAPAVPAGLEHEFFTDAHLAHVQEFTDRARAWSWSALALSAVFYAWLGLAQRPRRWVRSVPGPWWLVTVIVVAAAVVVQRMLTLPFAAAGWRDRVEVGLSTQTLRIWFQDVARATAMDVVLFGALALLVVGTARGLPRWWPAVTAGVLAVLVVVGSWLYPVVVEPLSNEFTPLAAGPLRDDVIEVAAAEGVEIDDVVVADASRRTTTYNAWVSGFGSTRRVVIYDTMVDELPRSEVLAVVAHELAHARHQHVLAGTALGAAGVVLGVGLLGLVLGRSRDEGVGSAADPVVVPVLLALVFVGMQLAAPVQNGISRSFEREADRVAVEVTGNPDAFVRLQASLAVRALSDPTPPRWSQFLWGSHPTFLERVSAVR